MLNALGGAPSSIYAYVYRFTRKCAEDKVPGP